MCFIKKISKSFFADISEMTYTVSSRTLNATIQYHSLQYHLRYWLVILKNKTWHVFLGVNLSRNDIKIFHVTNVKCKIEICVVEMNIWNFFYFWYSL